jgi:CRP-like cAMP-binding protein
VGPGYRELAAVPLSNKRAGARFWPDSVYKPNEPIDHVLFPENAVLCLLALMSNGDTIEAATVGREGASWISASVGAPSMPCETIVVIEGTALKLAIGDLDRELKENGHFRDVLTEYSHALLIASMRTSACNGLHGLQERCARWILMTLDRTDADRFHVTKEFLAQLLGTNRPTVSVLVSVFEKAGILNVKGRRVTLEDRNRLTEAACECYEMSEAQHRSHSAADSPRDRLRTLDSKAVRFSGNLLRGSLAITTIGRPPVSHQNLSRNDFNPSCRSRP